MEACPTPRQILFMGKPRLQLKWVYARKPIASHFVSGLLVDARAPVHMLE